jgi:hypothetical protein
MGASKRCFTDMREKEIIWETLYSYKEILLNQIENEYTNKSNINVGRRKNDSSG